MGIFLQNPNALSYQIQNLQIYLPFCFRFFCLFMYNTIILCAYLACVYGQLYQHGSDDPREQVREQHSQPRHNVAMNFLNSNYIFFLRIQKIFDPKSFKKLDAHRKKSKISS